MKNYKFELLQHLQEYGDILTDVPVDTFSLNKIIKHIETENYRQIYYDYEYNLILVLLQFFEKREEYIVCKVILEAIESINATTGENHKTHL